MKVFFLVSLNLILAVLFIILFRKRNLLSFHQAGRWWLTWLAIAVITLMDEFTSIFYAPAEAYRFIGPSAIFFIAVTSLLIRFMSTRFTEIAEILESHKLIGGGVYSFSYLVLGPMVSFVAVASIMVDYILTACISSVSAVLNAAPFLPAFCQVEAARVIMVLGIIWFIGGINILGIRENARFTFVIFTFGSFVILNLIVSGLISIDTQTIGRLKESIDLGIAPLQTGSLLLDYDHFISNVAFCILAYSGIESVIQTAGFVRNWQEIRKAYLFLAFTVGIVTPMVAALALSAPIDFSAHEGDLITHYAILLNGPSFGVAVACVASFTLIMAVNTAFVASSELLERVAHRYGFRWLIVTNKRQSLYRIHLFNACFFSLIILITRASQTILADMYALGLLASFCINMLSLIIYRYSMGTKEIIRYHTSRFGTLILFIILIGCFVFLAADKPYGLALWASVTTVVLTAGFFLGKKRSPEIMEIGQGESEMEAIQYLAKAKEPNIQVLFMRPREATLSPPTDNEVYITFYSPRQGLPPRLAQNHFRLPLVRMSLYHRIVGFLKTAEQELPAKEIKVQFGWPMSSWIDRIAIGVMVLNLMRLPRMFPRFDFNISYHKQWPIPKRRFP
jgi:amino acid transporter